MRAASISSPFIERVLVVDDHLSNRELLGDILAAAGYAVTLAEDGDRALASFERELPDIALLDILMPKMDGFELHDRMRAVRGGADVPIVFLTALTDLETHRRALHAGADDFLMKPINRTELLIRVRSLLAFRRLNDELRRSTSMIASQHDALARAQLQKDDMVAHLVHDLKNPLSSVLIGAKLLGKEPALSDQGRKTLARVERAVDAMNRLLLNMLDVTRAQEAALAPTLEETDLSPLFDEVSAVMSPVAEARSQQLVVSADAALSAARTDRELLRRIVENLVDNALKYAPAQTTVTVEARRAGASMFDVRVRDQGPGVPEADRERVFEKYARLDAGGDHARTSRGLGLAFCRMAAEVLGGRVWVEDNAPQGSIFCVRLPFA